MAALLSNHPDLHGWEVDEDLRSAQILIDRKSKDKSAAFHDRQETVSDPIDSAASLAIQNDRAQPEIQASSPERASALGGWRPWVFAVAGFAGGTLAIILGGISTKLLPTIIALELFIAIVVCFFFYPRRSKRPRQRPEAKDPKPKTRS